MSSSKKDNNEISLKILILGDSSVGKTSLLLRYSDGYFPIVYVATIGVEYKVKKVNIKGYEISLQIWDTAGQERFRSITNNFIKDADGIIYVYDITEKSTFDSLKQWINQSEESTGDFKKIIVGNKLDLESEREVKIETLEKFCAPKNIKYMETSAKNGANVEELFETLAEMIIGDQSKEEIIRKFSQVKKKGLSILSSNNKKNKSCC